jgi:tripartite-type tricarboxylate transporter receptor subunit TctC
LSLSRRNVLRFATGTAAIAAFPGFAHAQEYPSRTITVIVPFPAGGSADAMARLVAERTQEALGQSVVVENVPGAGGSRGMGQLARSAADGYTLGMGTFTTQVINPLGQKLPFNTATDYTPIGLMAHQPMIVVGRSDLQANNLKELIDWLKATPGKARQGTTGLGGSTHLAGILFQKLSGTKFDFIPYRGLNLAMQDLLANRIDLLFDLSSLSMPFVKSNKIKAFAIMGKERHPQMPEVPTVDEAGLPGFHMAWWAGLLAPAGTPKAVAAKLNSALAGALAGDAVRKRLSNMGYAAYPADQLTPEALGALQKSETAKWMPIVKDAGLYQKIGN